MALLTQITVLLLSIEISTSMGRQTNYDAYSDTYSYYDESLTDLYSAREKQYNLRGNNQGEFYPDYAELPGLQKKRYFYDDYSDFDERKHNKQQIEGKESFNQRKAVEKVHVPVIMKKKKKKQKIISIQKGVFIPGGTQVFGKFKSLKACMKACGATATCFAGDYNPWLGKCYFHSNGTACDTMQTHKKITHFKKVFCTVTDAPRGIIVLGAHLNRGVLQKGIDDLATCSKKCANAGGGVAASSVLLSVLVNGYFDHNQVCFAIDFNFATHECYFHTKLFQRVAFITLALAGNPICPIAAGQTLHPTIDLAPHPTSVHMTFCPDD